MVNFALVQAMKSRGGVEVDLYPFFKLGVRWEWVIKATPWPLYPRETDPVSIVQEVG
jgi:hypothetical protein